MPIQIGQRVDHGFDEPLGLLSDCHRRIEHFLGVLATVATQAAGGELIPSYRSALEGAIKYFAVAAPKHTADEEVSLFPRLRHSDDPALAQALASLDTLEHDHDEAEAHHAAVDELIRRWLADGRLSSTDADQLRDRLERLQGLYEGANSGAKATHNAVVLSYRRGCRSGRGCRSSKAYAASDLPKSRHSHEIIRQERGIIDGRFPDQRSIRGDLPLGRAGTAHARPWVT